jgi:hypothetical protein
MRGGIEPNSISGSAQDRADHGGGGSLSVGASDMDGLYLLMGIPEGLQDIPNIGQAKNNPMALQAVEII